MNKPAVFIIQEDETIIPGAAHVRLDEDKVYLHLEDTEHLDHTAAYIDPDEAVRLALWLLRVALPHATGVP